MMYIYIYMHFYNYNYICVYMYIQEPLKYSHSGMISCLNYTLSFIMSIV